MQPCCFSLYQWRREKYPKMTKVLFLPLWLNVSSRVVSLFASEEQKKKGLKIVKVLFLPLWMWADWALVLVLWVSPCAGTTYLVILCTRNDNDGYDSLCRYVCGQRDQGSQAGVGLGGGLCPWSRVWHQIQVCFSFDLDLDCERRVKMSVTMSISDSVGCFNWPFLCQRMCAASGISDRDDFE